MKCLRLLQGSMKCPQLKRPASLFSRRASLHTEKDDKAATQPQTHVHQLHDDLLLPNQHQGSTINEPNKQHENKANANILSCMDHFFKNVSIGFMKQTEAEHVLVQEIKKLYAARLGVSFGPTTLTLVGSRANDTCLPSSDIDLVMRSATTDGRDSIFDDINIEQVTNAMPKTDNNNNNNNNSLDASSSKPAFISLSSFDFVSLSIFM
jgi:hypothetical protein